MDDMWYREYRHVPSGIDKVQERSYHVSLSMLQTLDRFGIMEVRPSFQGRPGDAMMIWVDGVFYNEILSVWVNRFKNR